MSGYRVFNRTWWKEAERGDWPNGLEPHAGSKHYMGRYATEMEAQAAAKRYNATHEPGRYSRKAEYERSS